MNTEDMHKDDIGTVIKIQIMGDDDPEDISTATSMIMTFKKPDATTIDRTASFDTDGVDGMIKYTTIADDIDTVGFWEIQATITMPTGTWKSSVTSFMVHDNLS